MGLVLVFAQGRRFEAPVLLASGILVVNAAWRTVLPTSLESGLRSDTTLLIELGAAVGAVLLTDGWQSPFLLTLAIPIMIAGLARGFRDSSTLAGLAICNRRVRGEPSYLHLGRRARRGSAGVDPRAHRRRGFVCRATCCKRCSSSTSASSTRPPRLVTANQLLLALHDVAQSLPTSLDLGDVVASARTRFREQFDYTSAAILVHDDSTMAWRVELADGLRMPASIPHGALPGLLRQAQDSTQPHPLPGPLRALDAQLRCRWDEARSRSGCVPGTISWAL